VCFSARLGCCSARLIEPLLRSPQGDHMRGSSPNLGSTSREGAFIIGTDEEADVRGSIWSSEFISDWLKNLSHDTL
jgi:hypothetical protein